MCGDDNFKIVGMITLRITDLGPVKEMIGLSPGLLEEEADG